LFAEIRFFGLLLSRKIKFRERLSLMSFLPKPGEIVEDDDLYEFSGDEDHRLRKEYE